MRTHGYISIAPHLHGTGSPNEQYPGYRSEFFTYVDLFSIKKVIFNSLLGNTTIIKQSGKDLKLDRIRYNLTPGFRIEFDNWLLQGGLNHECIHVVSQFNQTGSIFWNSLQAGIGTKGAYYLYLREEFRGIQDRIINNWDAQFNLGYIIPAESTLLTGQNHDYNYEFYSLFRYQFAVVRNWAIFFSLRQHTWLKTDGETFEHKIDFTLNFFRKGLAGFAGLFYNYTIFDTYSIDNTEGLSALGLKIIF